MPLMSIIRIMKYPGSKVAIVPDIVSEFRRSGMQRFVDVFGGSGLVSLNIGAREIVYNEIDKDLVSLYRIIKSRPDDLYGLLLLSLPDQFAKEFPDNFRNLGKIPAGMASGKNESKGLKGERIRKLRYALSRRDGDGLAVDRELAGAYRTLFRSITSFGGRGDTYATGKEKGAFSFFLRVVSDFGNISSSVRNWKIERRDFREIFRIYDSPLTFFYLDPPYPGKDWYGYNFSPQDFKELAGILGSIHGKYFLSLNNSDDYITSMFGEPMRTKSFINQNAGKHPEGNLYRDFAYFSNIA
jgi:DNA adenine methylase